MNALFIGSTRRGFLTLEALLAAGARVAGILSLEQDAHETERFEGRFSELAESRKIPLRQTRLLKDPSLASWARDEIRAEVGFVVGARVLLPESLYAAFSKGCWAAHDSLLPAYRGFAPLNWAIINGEKETGITLFRVTAGVDTGDILVQRRLPIGPDDTAPQVYDKVCAASVEAVLEGWTLLGGAEIRTMPQDHARATFCCSRTPEDGRIDWNRPTRSIYNLIRALAPPYPGAFTSYEGRRLVVVSASPVEDAPRYVGRIPGRVVRSEAGTGVDVLTGDGVLRIREVSGEGAGPVPAAEVIRSVRARLGSERPVKDPQ